MEYLNCYITAARHIASKMATMEGRLVKWMLEKQYHYGDIFSGWMDLTYDSHISSFPSRNKENLFCSRIYMF